MQSVPNLVSETSDWYQGRNVGSDVLFIVKIFGVDKLRMLWKGFIVLQFYWEFPLCKKEKILASLL